MTRCPKCKTGAIAELSHDNDPRCVSCGFRWDDLDVHFPTPEESRAVRKTAGTPYARMTDSDRAMLDAVRAEREG